MASLEFGNKQNSDAERIKRQQEKFEIRKERPKAEKINKYPKNK